MKFFNRGVFILIIALCGSVSAQTTVRCDDSVVLILNGYNKGDVSWLESSNRKDWFDAQGTIYNDSLVFTAAATLYYYAIVTHGTCDPFYSDTIQVIVSSPPPIAKSASSITQYSFTAKWYSVPGAIDYFLDIATDTTFTSFIPGKKNIEVASSDTTYSIDGLECSTSYYYRVRAHDGNTCGISSGNSNTITATTNTCPRPYYCTIKSTCTGVITDSRNNQTYKTVQIGTQCWMAQNLNVGKMIMGALQPTPGIDNQDSSIEKYCYGDLPGNCTTYGGLYLWSEMMAYGLSDSISPGPQGVCPTGWHLPTDNEWKCMEMTIGMSQEDADKSGARGTAEGGKLKDTTHWTLPNTGANNKSGFTALPGGARNGGTVASFSSSGIIGYWWTATEASASNAWNRNMYDNYAYVARSSTGPSHINNEAVLGASVRCVKN